MDRKILTKYIHAFTMGDGGLYTRPNMKNAWYQTKKTESNKDMLDFQASILNELTSVSMRYIEVPQGEYNTKPYFTLHTKTHPVYTTIRERMYLEGRKVISLHDLKQLDAETLAILYMDDGSLHVKHNKTCTYIFTKLCTHGYTYAENDLLRRFIKDRFDIHFAVCRHRQRGNIYHFLKCTKHQSARFIKLVSPFILPSFKYKIEIPNEWLLSQEDDDIVETM